MLFLRQLAGELKKMFARKRTYIGFGAFLALEGIILILIELTDGKGIKWLIKVHGGGIDYFFSATTLGFFITLFTILLGWIYIALVAGDIVAKEAEDGSLRLVLSRPVSRLRVLVLKYCAAIIYNILFIFFIGFTAYLFGAALRGFGGGFFVFAPEQEIFALHPGSKGLARYAMGIAGLSVSMITVTSFAFFFSCMKVKPATATILALSCVFMDFVIYHAPFFPEIKEYQLTPNLAVWVYFCDTLIKWPDLVHGYIYLFGINLTLFTFGWAIFQSRDFKM